MEKLLGDFDLSWISIYGLVPKAEVFETALYKIQKNGAGGKCPRLSGQGRRSRRNSPRGI
jgi:hypothetical protein